MNDLARIQNDIAGCKRRIAEMEAGTRGQVPDGARHQGAGRAFENQLHAQRQALERFELEFVQAKLDRGWSAAEIIARMEAPVRPAPVREVITVRTGDETRGRLQSLLENTPGNFLPRSKIQELLQK